MHPISLVAISANNLPASAAFYSTLFGWQTHSVTPEVTAAVAPSGPSVSLRSKTPDGFPGVVPFIAVQDVDDVLRRAVAGGGAVERARWSLPMVGNLARFRDPSGTIYGLTDAMPAAEMPRVPLPFGANPKPPAGSICSLEMYAADPEAAGRFFNELFGWSTESTIPQYLAFDAGAGIGGVFQSHTPALPAVAYIYVGDVAATLQRIDAAGGKRTADAMPIPGMGSFGYFKDPSDTNMGLIGP